jgi:hypothetical protein
MTTNPEGNPVHAAIVTIIDGLIDGLSFRVATAHRRARENDATVNDYRVEVQAYEELIGDLNMLLIRYLPQEGDNE